MFTKVGVSGNEKNGISYCIDAEGMGICCWIVSHCNDNVNVAMTHHDPTDRDVRFVTVSLLL